MAENAFMTLEERHAQVESYLGKTITIGIDRPIGYVHRKGEKTLVYPINYGYIPGVLGGDEEDRKEALRLFRINCEAGRAIGAHKLVLHLSY